jgi:molybdopterin-guanine dinucleotide biosynthesis protein B
MKAFGIIGASGSGKTTLIEKIVPCLKARGLRVSTVKHAHHGFDMDRPGKDSWRHREAGAEEILVVSGGRWALLHQARDGEDLSLPVLMRRLRPVDIVLVEGFKLAGIPRLEVYRPLLGKPPLYPADPSISAVASDLPVESGGRPRLALNDAAGVADFVCEAL